jgi:hypothetical protein
MATSTRLRGIVSKRLGSPYRLGRSEHWVKVKNPKAPSGGARGGGRLGFATLDQKPQAHSGHAGRVLKPAAFRRGPSKNWTPALSCATNKRSLAYVLLEPGRRLAAKLLTKDWPPWPVVCYFFKLLCILDNTSVTRRADGVSKNTVASPAP